MNIFDRSRERADREAARADAAEAVAAVERQRAERAEADAAACERRYNPPVTRRRIVPGSYESRR